MSNASRCLMAAGPDKMNPSATGLSTALADRYRLERELGQGGMATVYLAHDLKHDRHVAIKVLRPELAAVIGAERFHAEIKTTANLQHPHILPLFDSGVVDGTVFYAMPFVEGESLRDRLAREKQLPIADAVRIATEVAGALDYAHRKGVIHRDIKPENILLHDGRALVADFGIALAATSADSRMTETGMSLGTPHYMSPEQAMGERSLDARTDIYALGCVLYEMLTGEPPFTGPTAQAIVAKVMTAEPESVSTYRKTVPAHVADAVTTALAKLPADRFASAAEFATALGNASFTTASAARRAATAPVSRWRTAFFAAGLVATVLLVLVSFLLTRPSAGPALTTYDVGLPDSATVEVDAWGALSVSPDGRFVVYVARRGAGNELWYRSLVDSVSRPIAGTTAVVRPVVSPSGEQVAFLTVSKLQVVPIGGGTATTLADVSVANLKWTADDRIMLMNGDGTSLQWFDPSGQSRGVQPTSYCFLPEPLGDGSQLLCGGGATKSAYIIRPGTDSVIPVPSASGSESGIGTIVAGLRGSDFRVIDGKYLVYMSIDGDLRATTIDLVRRQAGRSVSLVSAVHRRPYSGQGQFDISATGTLVYAPGANAGVGQLVRYRAGRGLDTLNAPPAAYLRFAMSGNGRWLAAVVEGAQSQELHVIDLATGRASVFLRSEFVGQPLWDPSSNSVMVDLDNRVTVRGSPSSSAAPDTVFRGFFEPLRYVSDSTVFGVVGGSKVVGLLDLKTGSRQLDTLVREADFPDVSPDGRWMTYSSPDLSRVFISPLRDPTKRYQVAVAQEDAQWLSPTQFLMKSYDLGNYRLQLVTIDPDADPLVQSIRDWFSDPRLTETPGRSFAVTPDGGVLYLQGPATRTGAYLRVVPGWVERMKRAVDEANR
jgi:eukaryotic-like serine/threonine-protein kinase